MVPRRHGGRGPARSDHRGAGRGQRRDRALRHRRRARRVLGRAHRRRDGRGRDVVDPLLPGGPHRHPAAEARARLGGGDDQSDRVRARRARAVARAVRVRRPRGNLHRGVPRTRAHRDGVAREERRLLQGQRADGVHRRELRRRHRRRGVDAPGGHGEDVRAERHGGRDVSQRALRADVGVQREGDQGVVRRRPGEDGEAVRRVLHHQHD
mmetsp:Transcript_136735/g.332394  ORF Transcript_136735/g.332394 Transcript_136735/m.332394 type:complete len:210 (+) Transcript_136735:371-1000(+)